jgi:hypothetical protein
MNYKFDFISPVWLQIKATGPTTAEIFGLHDADQGWMSRVRTPAVNATASVVVPKILPRVLFDGWTTPQFKKLFKSAKFQEQVLKLIAAQCKVRTSWVEVMLHIWNNMYISFDSSQSFRLVLFVFVAETQV